MTILRHPADIAPEGSWSARKEVIGGSSKKGQDLTPGAFKNLRTPLANALQNLLGKGSDDLAGLPDFQGEFSAPIGANEQALLNSLMTEGGGRQDLLNQTIAGRFLPGGAQENPFLQASIEAAQRQTAQTYEDILSRTLPGQFTQAGHRVQPGGSSPFATAAAIQSGRFAQELGDIATEIASGAYESERGRQQEAIGLGQQEVQTTLNNLQAQGLPRLIEQYGLDQGLAEFKRQNEMLTQVLSILAGVTAPAVAEKGSESTGILPSIAGGASGAALAFGG